MPLSSSILAFPDCQRVFERAIDSKKGVRLTFKNERAAKTFAFRCNQFRKLDRKQNEKVYTEPAHTMHGASVYDTISVRVVGTTVLMEKINIEATEEEIE